MLVMCMRGIGDHRQSNIRIPLYAHLSDAAVLPDDLHRRPRHAPEFAISPPRAPRRQFPSCLTARGSRP